MKKKKNNTTTTRAHTHTKMLRPDETFHRPDVENVQSYLSGFANLDFDAQYFLDYYDSP